MSRRGAIGPTMAFALRQAKALGCCTTDDMDMDYRPATRALRSFYSTGYLTQHGEKGDYSYQLSDKGRMALEEIEQGKRKVVPNRRSPITDPTETFSVFDFGPLIGALQSLLPMYQLRQEARHWELCR